MTYAQGSMGPVSTSTPGGRSFVWAAAPAIYTLIYPGFVNLFRYAVGDAGTEVSFSAGAFAGLMLALMFTVPLFGFLRALNGLSDPSANRAYETRARRLAYFVVIAPTMYCMVGVLQILLSSPLPDEVTWVIVWCLAMAWLAICPRSETAKAAAPPAPWLRVAHGISAVIVLAYVAFHLFNHLFALIGQDAHATVMEMGRKVYRSPVGEPVLVAAMLFQVCSGLILAWRWSALRLDFYKTFQVASGFYLSIYILGHMNSVFVLARTYFGIETGWDFATGAPNGLIHDPWSVRLITHYSLGVFLTIGHLFAGLRVVMLAHGSRQENANRIFWCGLAFSALLSLTIMLAMCGVRI